MEEEKVILNPIFWNENNDFQFSVHLCTKAVLRQLQHIFPDLLNSESIEPTIYAIPTLQHSKHDLVNIGEEIEQEKDRLLESFMKFAGELNQAIRGRGYWCDYIDPCSGLAMQTTHSNRVYSEVEGVQSLLQYRIMNAGCCKILLHPQWGSAVYPATIFTTIPSEILLEILQPYIRKDH